MTDKEQSKTDKASEPTKAQAEKAHNEVVPTVPAANQAQKAAVSDPAKGDPAKGPYNEPDPSKAPTSDPHEVPPLKGPGPDYDPRFKQPTTDVEVEDDPPSPPASPRTPTR